MNKSNTPEYRVWGAMVQRCTNPKEPAYKWYGNRGIKICKRWLKFDEFIKDMGERPSSNHSLDRINNNKNYIPSNCRWATYKEQTRNYRRNRQITYLECTYCMTDWAFIVGISPETLRYRLNSGWSIQDALTIKPNHSNGHRGQSARC